MNPLNRQELISQNPGKKTYFLVNKARLISQIHDFLRMSFVNKVLIVVYSDNTFFTYLHGGVSFLRFWTLFEGRYRGVCKFAKKVPPTSATVAAALRERRAESLV
jgi:hypothetical protein